MSYEKIDTPRLNTANVCLVNVIAGAVSAKVEPTVSTHTGISSCTINGSSEFTDSITGLTVKILLNSGNLSFDYIYNEPDTGAVTGSSSFSLEVSSVGNSEWKSDTVTYNVNLVCCLTDISISHAGNAIQYVSGLEQSIGLGIDYSAVKDICDGSTSTVLFTAAGNAFVGTPDTPGAYIGLVSGPDGEMPFNIAVRDTRLYTDQEYVVAVDDPSTVYADRGNIKIHTVSDNDGSKPFQENPGNGFYLSCSQGPNSTWVASYSDASNSSSWPNHKYEIECKDKGTDGGETADKDCMYYILGDCTCGSDKCIHTRGIRKLTDSEWSLKHNNSEVATATAPYNSLYPPSSGWSGATITGEAEIQYDGEAYTYMSSYDSVTYKPVKGKCTRMGTHTLNFYKHKENKSKSFNGWGPYGGPSSTQATTSYITYDTVTKKYVSGICTANIEPDNSSILKGAGPITGAALLTHPITGNYMDHALVIDKKGVGSGYGTSSGPYGVAVPDTMLPSYDWVQFYLNRPRTSCIMPYTGGLKASVTFEDDAKTIARWWMAETVCHHVKSEGKYETLDTKPLKTSFGNSNEGINCRIVRGFTSDRYIGRTIGITSEARIRDMSTSLVNCTYSNDIPDNIFGISSDNIIVDTAMDLCQETCSLESVHIAVEYSKYIVFDDILYELDGDNIVPLDCQNEDGECERENGYAGVGDEKCRIFMTSWHSLNNRPHLDGVLIETDKDSNAPVISESGTTSKRIATLNDLYDLDEDGSIKSIKYSTIADSDAIDPASIRTVRNTPSSISCYKIIKRVTEPTDDSSVEPTVVETFEEKFEFEISYGEFGIYPIKEEEIKTASECDLIVTYNVDIECSNSLTESVDYNYTIDPYTYTYTIWCDCDEPCTCGVLCDSTEHSTYKVSIENAFTVNAITGTIQSRAMTADDEENSSHYINPACTCDEEYSEECDGVEHSYSSTDKISYVTAALVDSKEGISTEYVGSDSCTLSDGSTTFRGSSSFGSTLGPCLYISYTMSGFGWSAVRGMSRKTGWGSISGFHGYCLDPHHSNGSSLVTSFTYEASYSSAIHTYDNDDDPDVTLLDTVSVNATNSRFELSPDGFLGLYIPKPSTCSGSSTTTYKEVDNGNGKYLTGSFDRTLSSGWKITLTKSGEGSEDSTSGSANNDGDSGEDIPDGSGSASNSCPEVKIMCFRESGKSVDAKGDATMYIPDGTYDTVFGDADAYASGYSSFSILKLPRVACGVSVFPFEAPNKDGGSYRSIMASSKAHIITDGEDGSSIYIGIPPVIAKVGGDCSYKYKAPEDTDLWCEYDWYLDENHEENHSDSYSRSASYSSYTAIQQDNKVIIGTKPIELPMFNPSKDITIKDEVTDENYFLLDHDFIYIDGTGVYSDEGYDVRVKVTIHWTSRPIITEDMAKNDTNDPIKLPIIESESSIIYSSIYEAHYKPKSKTIYTILQCGISSYDDVFSTYKDASRHFDYLRKCKDNEEGSQSSNSDSCLSFHENICIQHYKYEKVAGDGDIDADSIRSRILQFISIDRVSKGPALEIIPELHMQYQGSDSEVQNLNKIDLGCAIVIARRKQ